MILVVSDNLLAASPLSAENDDSDSSLFSFKNCSPPTSPAKLQGKLLLPDPASFQLFFLFQTIFFLRFIRSIA
jgi:hypothetical protein